MGIFLKALASILLLAMLSSAGGCGCGFDCNSGDDANPALLTLGLSDALPEDLDEVVIEVDSITFRRSGGEELLVDRFTIPALDLEDVASFQVNLLEYPGANELVVISGLQMRTGTWDEVAIEILTGDVNRSYVEQSDGERLPLNVQDGVLTLPGMRLSPGTQRYVVEFGLAQALQFQGGTDTYLLTSTGVRVEHIATAATLSGQVDTALFDTPEACRAKSDPEAGNRVYLYEGIGLATANLADVFTSASANTPPASAIAPFAVASLLELGFTGNWEYSFGYVPAGDYTVAFACDTAQDDSVDWNGLEIPLPANMVREVSLAEGEKAVCDLEEGRGC